MRSSKALIASFALLSLFLAPKAAKSEVTTRPGNEMILNYVVSIPTEGTHDFISNASFAGIGLEAAHYVTERLSLGLAFRWIRFSENDDRQTYTFDNGAITGEQSKAQNVYPIYARAKFDLISEEKIGVVPFAALNLGPVYAQRFRAVGNYAYNNSGWQFALAPEVGIYKKALSGNTGAIFTVRYDGGFGSDAIPAFSALSFSIGIRQDLP